MFLDAEWYGNWQNLVKQMLIVKNGLFVNITKLYNKSMISKAKVMSITFWRIFFQILQTKKIRC